MTIRDTILALLLGLAYLTATATEPRPDPQAIRGTATWYCSSSSACTRGYGPSDLVAAIDPATGIERGTRVTVRHEGRSVTVRIVDVCACAGARVIDLTSGAFKALSPNQTSAGRTTFLARGVIAVTLDVGGPAPTLPPTDTAS